jgi:hypothetical protein
MIARITISEPNFSITNNNAYIIDITIGNGLGIADTNTRAGSVNATGTLNQPVLYSSPMPNANYSLQWNDFGQGLGLQLVPDSKTANGFAFNSNYPGLFDYTITLYQ